ncbi:MAG TPA: 23S rRNA (pseudouridine(1915)-N(3))-methyltransferase RlmH [Pyrinomonadaceae bacterium]|nr:23S rRNA (pseudouridine(1915)-N(3))-methyltransferase RlmH [Pyrinomonadaceae bacterium]
MKFRFIWIGKTKDKSWKALQDEYLRRLSHFVKCEVSELKDTQDGAENEGERILATLNPKTFAVLLDVTGEAISSPDLAGKIEKWQNHGVKEVSFVIGGADGVSRRVAETADISLSLSFLTFTHEMARVVLLEQLYRAYTIIKGFPYQK